MKKIPLSKGEFALVDNEDYKQLMQRKWHCLTRHKSKYAATHSPMINSKRGKLILMHRLVNKTPAALETDHIDGNGLNNQKKNLRNATPSQNRMNMSRHKDSLSKYKGISWSKKDKIWRVKIQKNGISKYIGCFKNELDAAIAYDIAAIKLHGKFARLNGVKK